MGKSLDDWNEPANEPCACRPPTSAGSRSASRPPPRATPLPGNGNVLARRTNAVRRGVPDHDQMTTEVAAETSSRVFVTRTGPHFAREARRRASATIDACKGPEPAVTRSLLAATAGLG
jgi:hypothetical protein